MEQDLPTPFSYPKLSNNEFRLLSFNRTGSRSQLDLDLSVESLRTGPRPAYHAISYVWGDDTVVDTVLMNGKLKGISKTLVYVLTKLRQRLAEGKLFWVDALCIDQRNQMEKSFQISAMGPIYKFADSVHVFTGLDAETASLTAGEVLQLSAQFSEPPPPGFLTTDSSLISRGLPTLHEAVWRKLQVFFEAPWFQRLWVVQEAVLAGEIILHLPDSTVLWSQLIELIEHLRRYSIEDYLDGPVEVSQCGIQRSREPGRVAIRRIEGMRSQYIWQHSLMAILMMVRTKLCRDPMDRVYAWYWLLPEEMRAEITPRYLITSEIPYWRPFIELSHIALNAWRDLNSIPLACTIDRLPQLPSWCINIESDAEIFVYVGDSCRAGGDRSSEIGAHVATSREGFQLHLQGLQIGCITKKFEVRWLACRNACPHSQCATAWLLWFTGALDFVKMNSIPVEHLFRTCTLDRLCRPEGNPLGLTDLRDHYKSLVEYWCQCITNAESGQLNLNASQVLQVAKISKKFVSAMRGRRLFMTSMGTICLAHHAAEVGDILCVYEGASAVFVLRPKRPEPEGQQSTYSFISDAWVYGFMDTEAFDLNIPVQTFIVD